MIAKFEFKVTVHSSYGKNAPSCDPLSEDLISKRALNPLLVETELLVDYG